MAELGRQAVDRELSLLLEAAVAAVAGTLEVEHVAVLERMPDNAGLALRAGVGWEPGVVGEAGVGSGLHSQAGYTLASDSPVVVEDLSKETRFRVPPLLAAHDVIASMTVIIRGEGEPFRMLGAYTTRRRQFELDDVHFVRAVANVLADAIARVEVEPELATRLNPH